MDFLAKTELQQLIRTVGGPCISVFMPTHRAGVQTLQDPIRLKNLLREADQSLQATGLRSSESRELLEPVRALVEDYDFWQHQSDGLAIFRSRELFRLYRVPLQFPEICTVAVRFHLKPLLSLFAFDGHFYVLALSQNQVRVFQATRYSISELDLKGMPTSLAEALQNRLPERQVQSHTAAPCHGAHRAAIFHGHGGGDEDRKEMLPAYFRRVDQGIRDLLAQDRAPTILATVDYLYPIYRQANSNPELLEDWISGNPDNLAPAELHDKALAVALPHFLEAQRRAADQYLESAHTKRTSNSVVEILPAACSGRVKVLFVAVGVHLWGSFDPGTGETSILGEPTPRDQDLLNLAAIHTYTTGGTVYAVSPESVPGGGHVAAVFRY